AVRLGDTLMAPSEIKLHDYLRSFSYFYVEMPFSIIPTSEYIVPLVTLDVTIVGPNQHLIPMHIPAFFPPNEFEGGTKTLRTVEITRNFGIRLPEPDTLVPYLGI